MLISDNDDFPIQIGWLGKDYHAFPAHARQVCHQPGLGRRPTTSHSLWSRRVAWASCMRISESPLGTWCSGITSATYAEGPGFKSRVSTCLKQTKSNQANCNHSAVSFLSGAFRKGVGSNPRAVIGIGCLCGCAGGLTPECHWRL